MQSKQNLNGGQLDTPKNGVTKPKTVPDDIIVNMDGGVGGSWSVQKTEPEDIINQIRKLESEAPDYGIGK